MRYSLIKYYYSLFVRNNGVGSIFKPLIFEFPEDNYILNLEDDENLKSCKGCIYNFMIGSDLLVSPAVFKNTTNSSIAIPINVLFYNI